MRRNTRAIAARLERKHHNADMTTDPTTMSDSDLSSAIYRIQERNRRSAVGMGASFSDRIRVLVAEQERRRAGRL